MSCNFYAKSIMQCVINDRFNLLVRKDVWDVCVIDLVPPPGLEPGHPASEAGALSSELRGLVKPGFFHSAG